jgi:serine/threonine protein kinase
MESDSQPRVLITPDDLLGFEIDGRYRLDAIVGGGGMGVVYRTVQQNLNRSIAIKVLKLEDVDNKHRLDRFRREIDIVAQLTHPNIVRVFDTGRDPVLGLHYIAMELIDGPSLEDIMRGQRVAPELAMDVAYEIAAALTEPHSLGIIHRDIKPGNVLVVARSDDTVGVKVVDFGIARTESGGTGRVTTTGVVVGSPMYMAPEVTRGEALDPRTDLYALGVLLYEMISGRAPFGGSTPVAIMLRHAVEDPPSLAEAVGAGFRFPELVALVDDLLRKEMKDRPADAKSVLRALDAIRSRYGVTRVKIDSAQPIAQALGPFLEESEAPAELQEVDAYSPTTPVDAMGNTGSDSFAGWLVSDSARAVLGPTRTAATDSMEGPMETGRRPRSVGIIAVVAVVALCAIAAVALTRSEPTVNAEIGGDTETPAALAPEPVEAPAPQIPATPDVGGEQPPDLGTADAPEVAAVEGPPKPKPKPEVKPPTKDRAKDPPKEDEFDEGMLWVKEK